MRTMNQNLPNTQPLAICVVCNRSGLENFGNHGIEFRQLRFREIIVQLSKTERWLKTVSVDFKFLLKMKSMKAKQGERFSFREKKPAEQEAEGPIIEPRYSWGLQKKVERVVSSTDKGMGSAQPETMEDSAI